MVIGIAYGLLVNLVNGLLFHLTMKKMLAGKTTGMGTVYAVSLILRYAVMAGMIILFLKSGMGNSLGLMIGFTIGILIFTIWRVKSGTHTGVN